MSDVPERREDAASSHRELLALRREVAALRSEVERLRQSSRSDGEPSAAQSERTRTLLHTLADHAVEALYLMDAEGRTTFMNPAAEAMFGWTREEAMGRVLHDLIHHKRPDGSPFPISECSLGEVMSSGKPVREHEDEFIHKDGHWVPVSCSNAPVLADGKITGAVLVVHDLTERKRKAGEQKRREEFERQLIAIVSHDLRNPISAMKLAAQSLLRREDLEPILLKSLVRISSSGERASRLIGDLLDFTHARLGTGIPIQRSRTDLHGVVAQVVEEVQQTHPHRELRSQASGDGEGTWDSGRLAQIAANLLVNAVTYSPEDSLVTVRTRGEGDWVALEVHNLGPAIPEDLRSRLFEPFLRGPAEKRPNGGNLGLGLFIVGQLVQAHQGTLTVRSTESEGTTFVVRLPRFDPAG